MFLIVSNVEDKTTPENITIAITVKVTVIIKIEAKDTDPFLQKLIAPDFIVLFNLVIIIILFDFDVKFQFIFIN